MPRLNKYGEIVDESGGQAYQPPGRSVPRSADRGGSRATPGGGSSSSAGVVLFFVLLVIGAIVFVAVKQHEGTGGAQVNTVPQPSAVVSQAVAWPSDSESLVPNSFIAAVNGQVEGLVFFESGGAETVAKPSRVYATEFQQEGLRYINWEVAIRHPSRSYRQPFTIVAFLYSPDGSVRGQQQSPTYLEPDWTSSYHSNRWGPESGPWQPGTYRLSLFVDGVKIAAGTFAVVAAAQAPAVPVSVETAPAEPQPVVAQPEAIPQAEQSPPEIAAQSRQVGPPVVPVSPREPTSQGWHRFGESPQSGGRVEQPVLLERTSPRYPPLAKQARVQGVVRLSATIDREGRLRDIRVITGHPLLNRAAIEAVENWIYRPGRLNGEPIETNTQIDVNFTMGQ